MTTKKRAPSPALRQVGERAGAREPGRKRSDAPSARAPRIRSGGLSQKVAARARLAVLLMTAPSAEVAAALAKALLDERLIACANLVPGVRSLYRWKGALCDDAEVLVLMKTRADAFQRVKARVAALHPYEVPEVLALDVAEAHAPYAAWVLDCVSV